jgi:hypothetical protein
VPPALSVKLSVVNKPAQLIDREVMVRRDPFQNALECANFNWRMVWDDFVVLTISIRGDPNVRTFLASYHVIENA